MWPQGLARQDTLSQTRSGQLFHKYAAVPHLFECSACASCEKLSLFVGSILITPACGHVWAEHTYVNISALPFLHEVHGQAVCLVLYCKQILDVVIAMQTCAMTSRYHSVSVRFIGLTLLFRYWAWTSSVCSHHSIVPMDNAKSSAQLIRVHALRFWFSFPKLQAAFQVD